MSFILDTDICSIYFKQPGTLAHRFQQYGGRLFISAVALSELYTWAYRRPNPTKLLGFIDNDLLADVQVLDFNQVCARRFGALRSELLARGAVVNPVDLMIAATATVHDFTLVTHNTRHFASIHGLRLADWTIP